MPIYNHKNDNRLTAMMVEDMQFDPILAAKVILGLQIPPHEELRILWMWTTYYTNDDSGFSTGKSFTFAVVSALRSILFPHRTSGIISKTFAQGKLIFKNYDRWYNTSKIFRSCIATAGGKPRLLHSSEAFECYFRGDSLIRVLPPSFAQDAERLRGERWSDAYFDEWTVYGNFDALNRTIVGRTTKENEYQDCPVRQNHIHMASTPNFTHHPSYRIVRRIQSNINAGNTDHGRFTCNYRHIPKTKQWRWLINRKVIFTMQTTNPIGVVRSEIDGVWQEDSMSYYSSRDIAERRQKVSLALQRLRPTDIYIGGFDTARGNDRGKQSGDDFALSVCRLVDSKVNNNRNLEYRMKPEHCLTIRFNNINAKQIAGIIHDVHRKLQLSVLVYDPAGGGLWVRDQLRESYQTINNQLVPVTPIVDPFDSAGVIGDGILHAFRRSNFFVSQMWGKMQSDSVIINRLHQSLKGAIENGDIILAEEWHGWEDIRSQWDADSKRNFLNKNPGISWSERVRAEMDLAVDQLILVDVKRDNSGKPIIDSHQMYKFGSKEKKDSAYSLAYMYMGCMIYQVMDQRGIGHASTEQNAYPVAIGNL